MEIKFDGLEAEYQIYKSRNLIWRLNGLKKIIELLIYKSRNLIWRLNPMSALHYLQSTKVEILYGD